MKNTRSIIALFILSAILLTSAPVAVSASDHTPERTGASIFSWDYYLLNEGSYSDTRSFLKELNIDRVYQSMTSVYLQEKSTAKMVGKLADDGIETVLLLGERSWGEPGNSLNSFRLTIDALAKYNKTIGKNAQIKKVALDVEPYTHGNWEGREYECFEAFIGQMREAYLYAHKRGIRVVQIIPTFYDGIDKKLLKIFIKTCCDEISLMNYVKNQQLKAMSNEFDYCQKYEVPIETIFETKPVSNAKDGTDKDSTFFYDGFDSLMEKWEEIRYIYGNDVGLAYHQYRTMYHVFTGLYLAELYVYTDSRDPYRNELGQTDVIEKVTLTGSDGSVLEANIYNPNLAGEHPETSFLVYGVKPDVTYRITTDNPHYTVKTDQIKFTYAEGDLVDYKSVKVEYHGVLSGKR